MQDKGWRDVVTSLESSVQRGTGQCLLQEKSRAQVLVLRELSATMSRQNSRHVHPQDHNDSQVRGHARATPYAGEATPQRLLHLGPIRILPQVQALLPSEFPLMGEEFIS